MREQLGGGGNERIEVDEVVLVGDISDRTLSSTAEIITQTNAFIQTLRQRARDPAPRLRPGQPRPNAVDQLLPRAHAARRGLHAAGGRPPRRRRQARRRRATRRERAALGILRLPRRPLLAQHPGRLLRARRRQPALRAPTHGTHFRSEVNLSQTTKEPFDHLEVDRLVGHIEIDPGRDPRAAKDLEELEAFVAPFVHSLWSSSKNNPTSRSDQLCYLLTCLGGKLSLHRRRSPDGHALHRWEDLPSVDEARVNRLVGGKDLEQATGRCVERFLDRAKKLLGAHDLPSHHLTFVYGDTHRGGWGQLPDSDVRFYNTGAWVVHNPDDHPPCHLFAVDDAGQEYLADVSFRDVIVDGEPLLKLAAADAENKKRATIRILRFALEHVKPPTGRF